MIRNGTWRRFICAILGHENVITLHVMTHHPQFTCLRCWSQGGPAFPVSFPTPTTEGPAS